MLSVLWFKRLAGISFGQGPQSSSRVKQKKKKVWKRKGGNKEKQNVFLGKHLMYILECTHQVNVYSFNKVT